MEVPRKQKKNRDRLKIEIISKIVRKSIYTISYSSSKGGHHIQAKTIKITALLNNTRDKT